MCYFSAIMNRRRKHLIVKMNTIKISIEHMDTFMATVIERMHCRRADEHKEEPFFLKGYQHRTIKIVIYENQVKHFLLACTISCKRK